MIHSVKVICAWCGALLGCRGDPSAAVVSHGICRGCREQVLLSAGVGLGGEGSPWDAWIDIGGEG